MDVKKTILNLSNCNCGNKQQLHFELSSSLEAEHLTSFINNNYTENKSYTKIGLVYIEDNYLVAIGPIGSNRLQIKCKTVDCNIGIDKLENIIKLL